jgi:hypothetical protein
MIGFMGFMGFIIYNFIFLHCIIIKNDVIYCFIK